MVDISLENQKTVKIRGRKASLLLNPTQDEKKDQEAIILIPTKGDVSKLTEGGKFIINGPGEYEIEDVEILGLSAGNSNSIYQIRIDGVYVCHLGEELKKLSQDQIEELSLVDVLIVPAFENQQTVKLVCEIISQLEPKIVIPLPDGEKSLESFLHELGKGKKEKLSKVSINREKLPEELEVALLRSD